MALNSLYCADVSLTNYSLTHFYINSRISLILWLIWLLGWSSVAEL